MLKLSSAVIFFIFLSGCSINQYMIKKEIAINNQVLITEVAGTLKEQSRGLSGRADLCQNCAMLFPYKDYQIRNFWMKGMEFSLDFIWLKDGEIAGFSENIPVLNDQAEISRVQSPSPVNQVLEVRAGWVRENNVKIGDKAEGLESPKLE